MTELIDHVVAGQSPQGPDSAWASRASLVRRYVGPPGRQVHLLEGGSAHGGRPLYCLHATAYSGRSLAPLVQSLASHRRVVAMDTPGYGASDPPAGRLDLAGYVRAIEAALDAAGETDIDVFGYHTGALIAAELARRQMRRVRCLVLIGIPYFSGSEQDDWRQRLAQPMHLGSDLSQFQEKWDFLVGNRPPGVDLAKGFENFVDELRAYPNGWWAHDAAFRFDVERCFAQITQPTLVLNPHNHLAAASRLAAAALSSSRIVEMPHLANAIFDVAAPEIASLINTFLRGADKDHQSLSAQGRS